MATVTIRYKGDMVSNILQKARWSALRSANAIAQEVKTEAIENYKAKRKSTNPTSFIVQSFFVIPARLVGPRKIMAHVTVGGPTSPAPYTIYVEEGHTLRNGEWLEGYHFVRDAVIEVDKKAELITLKEFSILF